jgi:GT2 family glycosyltransferase
MFDLSVVIVNYKTPKLTADCIASIKKFTKNIQYEVILIDNSKNNRGFTGGNNVGMKKAKGRYVLLLNSDTLIHDKVLGEMVAWMDANPKIGISTSALKNKDGSIQGTGGYFPSLLTVFSWMTIQDLPFVDRFIKPFHPKLGFYKKMQNLDWVTGAFMLIRREVIDQIGYLDEDYFMYTEDTDFCFRAKKKGFKVTYNPNWSITHFGGASSTKEFPLLSEFKNVKLFYKKHYPKWQYPMLRILLKIGSIWRVILINPKIYAKAFKEV